MRQAEGACGSVSPDGHVSVLGLAWLGTALQWCLGDSWHGLVHQHLLVLHSLTCSTHKTHGTCSSRCQQQFTLITGNSTTTEQMWKERRRHSWSSLEPDWILILGGEGVKVSIYQEMLTNFSNDPLKVVTYKNCNLAGYLKVFSRFFFFAFGIKLVYFEVNNELYYP